VNVRDVGSLRTQNGGRTVMGRIVRSDNPALLTADGRAALGSYGIKTIIWLKSAGKPTDGNEPPSVAGLEVKTITAEDLNDPHFVSLCVETGLWCTPLYFPLMLTHWPSVCVEIVHAVATAEPGGVMVSCLRGRDRTGLAVFLLLALAQVEPEEIAADWKLSVACLESKIPSYADLLADLLAENGTSVVDSIRETCKRFPVAEYLLSHGLKRRDLRRVRRRLLGAELGAQDPRGIAPRVPAGCQRPAGEIGSSGPSTQARVRLAPSSRNVCADD
jgi:hypothetical protein